MSRILLAKISCLLAQWLGSKICFTGTPEKQFYKRTHWELLLFFTLCFSGGSFRSPEGGGFRGRGGGRGTPRGRGGRGGRGGGRGGFGGGKKVLVEPHRHEGSYIFFSFFPPKVFMENVLCFPIHVLPYIFHTIDSSQICPVLVCCSVRHEPPPPSMISVRKWAIVHTTPNELWWVTKWEVCFLGMFNWAPCQRWMIKFPLPCQGQLFICSTAVHSLKENTACRIQTVAVNAQLDSEWHMI